MAKKEKGPNRSEMIGIKVTPEDREMILKAAKSAGFKKISTYCRHLIMRSVRIVIGQLNSKKGKPDKKS